MLKKALIKAKTPGSMIRSPGKDLITGYSKLMKKEIKSGIAP